MIKEQMIAMNLKEIIQIDELYIKQLRLYLGYLHLGLEKMKSQY